MHRATTKPLGPVAVSQVRHIVAIGASAGGLHSIFSVLEPLPADFNACICVTTHLSETHNSILPELLARRLKLPVLPAKDYLKLRTGMVFVAPPRFHLKVSSDHLCLIDDPPVRFLRPNLDLFFHSVAENFGARAIGVILSGTGHDGADGIRAIKNAGGVTIIEDPTYAEFADMPIASNRTGCVDFVLPLDQISKQLVGICALTA